MPISICRCSDCAWYQGCRPSGSVFGRIQRGSLSMTANSVDFQSMSVYGLKLRRTDPSDSVFSISTYLVSSRTSMLRRHRRMSFVLAVFCAMPGLPNEVYIWACDVQHSTEGIGNLLDPKPAMWPICEHMCTVTQFTSLSWALPPECR